MYTKSAKSTSWSSRAIAGLKSSMVVLIALSIWFLNSPKAYAQSITFSVTGQPVGDSYDVATVTPTIDASVHSTQCFSISLPPGLLRIDRVQADWEGINRWWQGILNSSQYCVDPNNPIPLYIGAREVTQDTTYTFTIDSTEYQVVVAAASYSFSPSTQNADQTNNPFPEITGTRNKVFPYYIPAFVALPYSLTSSNCGLFSETDGDAYFNFPRFQPTLSLNGAIHYLVDDSSFTFNIGQPDYETAYDEYELNNTLTCNFNLTYNDTQTYSGSLTVAYSPFSQDTGDTEGCDDCSDAGEPINLSNGNTWITQTDYSIPGLGGGLSISRTWNSLWPKMGPPSTVGLFGNSWTSEWEQQLQFSLSQIGLWRGNGSQWIFTWNGDANAYTVSTPPNEKATLVGNGDGTYTVTMKDGFQYIFGSNGRLQKTQDRNGNGRTLTWTGSKLTSIADDAGRFLTFAYNDPTSSSLVTSVLFGTKVVANYFYTADDNHYLTKVTYPDTAGYNFQYLSTTDPAMQGLIEQVQDSSNKVLEAHTYDPYRRGLTSGRADVDGTGPVEGITVTYDFFSGEGTITNSLGDTTFLGFDYIGRRGYMTEATGPGCATCGSRGMNWFSRDDSGRALTHYVPTTNSWDNLHGVNYTYDDNNNVTSITQMLQDAGEVGLLRKDHDDSQPVLAHNTEQGLQHSRHSVRFRSMPNTNDVLTKTEAMILASESRVILKHSDSSPLNTKPEFNGISELAENTAKHVTFDPVLRFKPASFVMGPSNIFDMSDFMIEPAPVDPNVQTWSYTYNNFAEVLTQTDPLGNVTTNTYDAHGNLLSTTTPDSGVTSYTYDAHGNVVSITDPRGNVTQMTYTAVGLLKTVRDAQHNLTCYEYDNEGNRTAIVDAMSNRTEFSYDVRNRHTGTLYPDGATETIAYDLRGRKTSQTVRGVTTSYGYDDANRMISVTTPNSTTSYTYDTEDEITSITDALNNTTSYSWGVPSWAAGRRILQTTFPSGAIETYQYDNAGRLNLTTLRDGESVSAIYDTLGRMTQKGFADNTGTSTGTISFTYDLANNLTQVTDPNTSSTYTYDVMGRKLSSQTEYAQLPSLTFALAYTYDQNSNRTQMTYPNGETVNYVYDSLNRPTSLTDSEAGAFTLGYDILGRRTSLTRPNGVSTNYVYDVGSKLLSLTHQGTTVLDGAVYAYNTNRSRIQRTDLRTQTTEDYVYDGVNQLTRVDQSTPSNPMAVKERFLYDALGNRLGADTAVNTYGVSNELLSTPTGTYTYDGNGNLSTTNEDVSGASTSYTWDSLGRMLSVQGQSNVTFSYDYLGRRIAKGDSFYVYDGNNIVLKIDNSGSAIARYLQGTGIDEHLAEHQGQWYYYEQDGLGSVTSLTDSTGNISTGYTYSSFGISTQDAGALDQPYRYTGREWDAESNLYYYRTRYFDPTNGHFVSEDPYWGNIGSNLYAYVSNDPTNSVDPTGETTQVAIGGSVGNNVFGHASIIINGQVFSYGTNYAGGAPGTRDWGANAEAFLNAQNGFRETELLTLDITQEQENALLHYLQQHNPYAKGAPPYSAVSHSCVSVTETALIDTGIETILNQPTCAGGECMSLMSATTPIGLETNLVLQPGLVSQTSTVGHAATGFWGSLWGTVKYAFSHL